MLTQCSSLMSGSGDGSQAQSLTKASAMASEVADASRSSRFSSV